MSRTYEQVRRDFGTARDKDFGKPMGMANTRLRVSRVSPTPTHHWNHPDTVFALVFWSTEIVRWFPSGLVGASLNGWNTMTTKKRLREYGPKLQFELQHL